MQDLQATEAKRENTELRVLQVSQEYKAPRASRAYKGLRVSAEIQANQDRKDKQVSKAKPVRRLQFPDPRVQKVIQAMLLPCQDLRVHKARQASREF